MRKYFLITLLIVSANFAYSQWNIIKQFTTGQTIMAVRFVNPNTGYAVSVLYSGFNNIKKTTDAGASWIEQNSGYTGTRFMSIFAFSADTVYMSGNFGIIIRTTNAGQNWNTLIQYGDSTQYWSITFVNRTTGYTCGSYGRIKKTTDAGLTWVQQSTPTQTSLSSLYFLDENTGFCSGYAIVLKTTNAGQTWTNMNAPFISPFENFREIYFKDQNTGWYASDAGRLLKSTNGGANWNLTNTNTTKSLFALYFVNALTGYSCGSDTTIIKTTDGGDNWSRQYVTGTMNNGEILNDVWFTDINTGYIVTWYSKILKTTNGGVTFISKTSENIPEEFRLEQNYPNPFNPSTTITFDNNRQQKVVMEVYDIKGELVEPLFNGILSSGTYNLTWNATGKASGIYLLKLSNGNDIRIMKMILAK